MGRKQMQKSKFIAALGVAALLLVLPTSAMANVGGARAEKNVGGAGPSSFEPGTNGNVGGAGPRTTVVDHSEEFANVGGASPTMNVGGAGPRSTLEQPTQEFANVGGASPSWSVWLLNLLVD
jgi:hypothetical protein